MNLNWPGIIVLVQESLKALGRLAKMEKEAGVNAADDEVVVEAWKDRFGYHRKIVEVVPEVVEGDSMSRYRLVDKNKAALLLG
jgi:hypothetical protein